MPGLSNSARAEALDLLIAQYPNAALRLYSTEPDASGQGGTELTGGGYQPAPVPSSAWGAATSADPSVKTNTSEITFPQTTGAVTGTGKYAVLWKTTGSTAVGQALAIGQLTTPVSITTAVAPRIIAGALRLELAY